ncbi:microtubule-binding protein TANGLED [Ipomoea triloba]|uniref:microtubule-binding protein TANGLED n=1 Tax=Ipomoea triloba TaxID=35885 RepID=UPI00125CD6DA|nr:microtubule-binding protein TANGLED [Ipomoea triloba]
MVARTPPKLQHRKMAVPPLNPILLRETLSKVDKCMARLQELQYTVTGGSKVISGVTLSPRSTRGYLRTSLRCKQESLRIKNATSNRSPHGKLPATTKTGEWKRMSLPAMLLGETVNEILEASQFARKIVEEAAAKDDPKTPPLTIRQKKKPSPENSELRARRKKEKQVKLLQATPSLQRARSRRINFKVVVSPPNCERENCNKYYMANRVSPRHRPWAKKTVLFPNPVFHSSSPPTQKLSRTKSPVIANAQPKTPHKFLIKSPHQPSKFQVKIRSPPLSISPTRTAAVSKKSPKMSTAAKLRRSFSPSRLANKLVPSSSPSKMRKSFSPSRLANKLVPSSSPSKMRRSFSPSRLANKLVSSSPSKMMRRSFSPSRLANKLVSPLKSRKPVQNDADAMKMMMSGLKQRPSGSSLPKQFPARRL